METGVLSELRRRLHRLSDGQAKIAKFVLKHPDDAKAMVLKDLCTRCETSEPVVFALCRGLGLEGFSAFKMALAEDLGAARNQGDNGIGDDFADQELHASSSARDIFRRMAVAYRHSAEATLASVNLEAFDAAVDLLERAKRIAVIGVGISGNAGFVALQNFMRAGTPVSWTNDPNLNFTHLAPLAKGDVCLALSQTGNQRDTAEGVAFARKRNLSIISVTSDPESPIAQLADVLLLTAPMPVSLDAHLSIGAQIAIPILLVTDALAVALSARRKEAFLERAKVTAEAMESRVVPNRRRRRA